MTAHIIPTMENIPISRIDELHTHLSQLQDAPETPIDVKLLDDVELQLTGISLSYNGY